MTRSSFLSKRSVLAVPGSSEKMIQKARLLSPDEIFLDLEDSVSPSEKEAARSLVIIELNKGGFSSSSVAVRVNEQNQLIGVEDIEQIIWADKNQIKECMTNSYANVMDIIGKL